MKRTESISSAILDSNVGVAGNTDYEKFQIAFVLYRLATPLLQLIRAVRNPATVWEAGSAEDYSSQTKAWKAWWEYTKSHVLDLQELEEPLPFEGTALLCIEEIIQKHRHESFDKLEQAILKCRKDFVRILIARLAKVESLVQASSGKTREAWERELRRAAAANTDNSHSIIYTFYNYLCTHRGLPSNEQAESKPTDLIGVTTVIKDFNVSRSTVYRDIESGDLRTYPKTHGGKHLVSRAEAKARYDS